MVDAVTRRRPGVRIALILPLLVLVGGALAWTRHRQQREIELSKNYVLEYREPAGWKATSHGPETLFRWIEPKTDLVLRGAVNQVISPDNPTPDLDTEGIANYYVDRTKDNMPNWTATKLGTAHGEGMDFEVVRRSTIDRIVVTAYYVKGNTTVLVTLFGRGKAKDLVDSHMQDLYSLLSTLSVHEKDMSNM